MVVNDLQVESDGLTNMDVEETQSFRSYLSTNDTNGGSNFEQELSDIDAAIGFVPKSPAGIPTLSASYSLPPTPIPTTHAPPKSPRVLGDITNTVQSHPKNTKSQTGKKSWKRLARDNGEQLNTHLGITQGKRLSSSMEDEIFLEAGMKKQRGTFYDPISVEAVEQPCRAP